MGSNKAKLFYENASSTVLASLESQLTPQELKDIIGSQPVGKFSHGMPSAKANRGKGAQRTGYNGRNYLSKLEARYARCLETLKLYGEVVFYLEQIPFRFPDGHKYVCDFQIFWSNGQLTFEDTKGYETDTFKSKIKMMSEHYPSVEILLKKDKDVTTLERGLNLTKFQASQTIQGAN